MLKESQAFAAGFREGDVVLKLGRLTAGSASLSEFDSALRKGGRLEFVVQRGLEEHSLAIEVERQRGIPLVE